MARIVIEELNVVETLTAAEEALIVGAGFRPSFEEFEARDVPHAGFGLGYGAGLDLSALLHRQPGLMQQTVQLNQQIEISYGEHEQVLRLPTTSSTNQYGSVADNRVVEMLKQRLEQAGSRVMDIDFKKTADGFTVSFRMRGGVVHWEEDTNVNFTKQAEGTVTVHMKLVGQVDGIDLYECVDVSSNVRWHCVSNRRNEYRDAQMRDVAGMDEAALKQEFTRTLVLDPAVARSVGQDFARAVADRLIQAKNGVKFDDWSVRMTADGFDVTVQVSQADPYDSRSRLEGKLTFHLKYAGTELGIARFDVTLAQASNAKVTGPDHVDVGWGAFDFGIQEDALRQEFKGAYYANNYFGKELTARAEALIHQAGLFQGRDFVFEETTPTENGFRVCIRVEGLSDVPVRVYLDFTKAGVEGQTYNFKLTEASIWRLENGSWVKGGLSDTARQAWVGQSFAVNLN